jgi:hypothetical protein
VAEEQLLTGEQRDIEELREELLATKNEEDLPRLVEDLGRPTVVTCSG